MIRKLTKLATYLDKEDLREEVGVLHGVIRAAQGSGAPALDDVKVAAAYPGNMGMMEMFQFQRDADPAQQKAMDRLLEQDRTSEAWDYLKEVTGVDLVDPPGHTQARPPSSEEDGIASAVNKILKPGFDILGHGTSLSNAKLILKNGFSLRGHPLISTFLSMSADGGMPIAEQLKRWPYGETSQGEAVGVAIMRLPKDMITKYDSPKLTEMVSVEPKVALQPQDLWQQDGLPRKLNFDEMRTIPSFFFFALWDEKNKSLVLNSNYDEAKILEHLSLNESAIAAPEPTQPLPTQPLPTQPLPTQPLLAVTESPEDSDYDIF
jgi:hypothetical protein